ncbi:MAG: hypothetical protein AB1813_10075 [Verrucomicrobiota bacterium]|jgi:hypothetical protein
MKSNRLVENVRRTAASRSVRPELPQKYSKLLADARAQLESEFRPLRDQDPRIFHLTLNEAEALAWETKVPHLVFPTLASEKLNRLNAWLKRQAALRAARNELAFAA